MSEVLDKFFESMRSYPTFESYSAIDIRTENCVGETALHFAAILNDVAIAKELLSHGAEPNKKGEHGFTPIHEAIQQGNTEMIRLLLENGADTLIKNDWDMDSFDLAELGDSERAISEVKGLLEDFTGNHKGANNAQHHKSDRAGESEA